MSRVVVIDYGSSNLRSVAKALEHVADTNHSIEVSDRADTILAAERIVFPGQGAMGQCMASLGGKGLDDVIRKSIPDKPFLGICLGLQTLMDESDEDGSTRGLGIIPGRVTRFQDDCRDADGNRCKIPHMGWNRVSQKQAHALWNGIDDGTRFYFVHSYYVIPEKPGDIAATTEYTLEFTSAVARDNLFATQFHPEKSQQAGLTLLKNFLDWNP
ncbi:MAG TPA: imidazole glycerol phosphate synthase subunit HisH [Gammaproteobacteria bacterium]|nr:imidazole glycerol phosphate synthase subunit HisH [Gammaproteobacteria bacterium]